MLPRKENVNALLRIGIMLMPPPITALPVRRYDRYENVQRVPVPGGDFRQLHGHGKKPDERRAGSWLASGGGSRLTETR